MSDKETARGARVYTPLTLKFYDWYVLGLSCRFAWECSTSKVLLPFFRRHLGKRHMDVGVGTGYYLANAKVAPTAEITLMDLSKNSLEATAKRIAHCSPHSIQHDIFEPLPLADASLFDSISAFYLLHCLPGTMADKGKAIANLKTHLTPGGVLYGATILGDTVQHNWFGARLMAIYNKKGIFCNRADSVSTLREMLEEHFQDVDVSQSGKVALFTASRVKTS